MKRKILVVISALTIALSILAGLTMAAPRVKLKPLVLLGSYDGHFLSDSIGSGPVESSYINTDKPAIFTISVIVTSIDAPPIDSVYLTYLTTPTGSWIPHSVYTTLSPTRDLSIAVAGYGVGFLYFDDNVVGLDIEYCIIVEGEEDTVVEFGSP